VNLEPLTHHYNYTI